MILTFGFGSGIFIIEYTIEKRSLTSMIVIGYNNFRYSDPKIRKFY